MSIFFLSLALLLKNIYDRQLPFIKKKKHKNVLNNVKKYYPSKLTFPNQWKTFAHFFDDFSYFL